MMVIFDCSSLPQDTGRDGLPPCSQGSVERVALG